MKKRILFFLMLITVFNHENIFAQNFSNQKQKVYKVGIFAPLYLDSVFVNYQLKSDVIPRFIQPALEFVQGAQIAFDTLSLNNNERVEGFIYDTRSYTQPLSWLIKNRVIDSLDLIIGSVKDVDYKELAEFSQRKKIPFISATYPNDGGITDDPYLTILNSTLRAHCEGIHSYILETHGTDKIYLIRKSGHQEDKIAAYFKAINEQEGKPPLLNIQTIKIDSNITASYLKTRIDTLRNAVIIGGSLDENFAKELTDACYTLAKKYPVSLIGMPNWNGFRFFTAKNAYKDFPIRFTTPFYNSKSNVFNTVLTNQYYTRFKSKPTDMAYKGFESVYLFTKLLLKYPNDFMTHLNDKSFTVFSEFNFRPVMLKKNNKTPDYIENKHLYVMRILNGVVAREW